METRPELPPVVPGPAVMPSRRGRWRLLLVAALIAGGGWIAHWGFVEVRDGSRLKAMIPRQSAAMMNQFFLETGDRIFLSYTELYGPQAYLKGYNAVDGEDLSVQFPLRRYWSDSMP